MVGHFNAARQEEGIYEQLVTLQTSLWRYGSHAEGAEGKEAEDGSHIYGVSGLPTSYSVAQSPSYIRGATYCGGVIERIRWVGYHRRLSHQEKALFKSVPV